MSEERSYDRYVKEKANEFNEIIDEHIADLEKPARTPRVTLGRVDVKVSHIGPQFGTKKEIDIYALDIVSFILAAVALIIPFFRPDWQIAYAFGAVLLFSVFTRSIVMRLAAICFTTLYLIFGAYIDLSSVLLVVFGVNTITLGPVVVSILFSALIS